MTGPEHYREAERLLSQAMTSPDLPGQVEEWAAYRDSDLAAAQVHATLAQTAATAYPAAMDYCGEGNQRGWHEVTS